MLPHCYRLLYLTDADYDDAHRPPYHRYRQLQPDWISTTISISLFIYRHSNEQGTYFDINRFINKLIRLFLSCFSARAPAKNVNNTLQQQQREIKNNEPFLVTFILGSTINNCPLRYETKWIQVARGNSIHWKWLEITWMLVERGNIFEGVRDLLSFISNHELVNQIIKAKIIWSFSF